MTEAKIEAERLVTKMLQVRNGTDRTQDHIDLDFEDTDIGVAEPERVFERFYRTGVARNRFADGTGFCLPRARSIVEAHGGSIWMESAIFQGSRVIVRLPRTSGAT